jgi:hypothetical protein
MIQARKKPRPILCEAGMDLYENRGIIKKKDVTLTKISKKAGKAGKKSNMLSAYKPGQIRENLIRV